jgi:precorrin-6Y C5,15-methyltransferase (decarboxylating)
MGEDGPDGLSPASQDALRAAEIIMGPARHLELLPEGLQAEQHTWPVPFSDGLDVLLGFRGRPVAALASGDPFWFGAGSVIARHLAREEWRALPGPSTFSLIAAHMGWPLEQTRCLGLHAAPLARLRPYLAPGERLIVLLRDGDAVPELAGYLTHRGFGQSALTICEAMGGPRRRVTSMQADDPAPSRFHHPVAVAIAVAGKGAVLPCVSGLPDDLFEHDGQITKRAVRALTLSALAARPGEHLWDIGGGAGSIAIEWLLSHPATQATSIERDAARAARIRTNAENLGVDRLQVVEGTAPGALADLAPPQAVFIGGGLTETRLEATLPLLPQGCRLVANAVTLEAESLLADKAAHLGGTLTRIELSTAAPLGSKRGWKAAYPIVQWSVTL